MHACISMHRHTWALPTNIFSIAQDEGLSISALRKYPGGVRALRCLREGSGP